jgi:hypothetical protein
MFLSCIFHLSVNKWAGEMAFQSFSPKLRLAMTIAKAKGHAALPIDQAEKERRKQVSNARDAIRRAENLAQRALIQGRRRGPAAMT